MTEDQIPQFVGDVLATGCEMWAVGTYYILGDADLTPDAADAAAPALMRIDTLYGDRDHLTHQIVAYLRSLGRFSDVNVLTQPEPIS